MAEPTFDAKASTVEVAAHCLGGSLEAEDELLARAGAGELQAQQIFAQTATCAFLSEKNGNEAYLAVADAFARLAASHGYAADRRRLAAILSLEAALCRSTVRPEDATPQETECLIILNQLADEGYEEAAEALATFAEEFSEDAVKLAAAEAKPRNVGLLRRGRPHPCAGRKEHQPEAMRHDTLA